jgi:hypothetical protein
MSHRNAIHNYRQTIGKGEQRLANFELQRTVGCEPRPWMLAVKIGICAWSMLDGHWGSDSILVVIFTPAAQKML